MKMHWTKFLELIYILMTLNDKNIFWNINQSHNEEITYIIKFIEQKDNKGSICIISKF